LHSNIQYKLPQTQGRAVSDTRVCYQQCQQVTSLSQRKTNISTCSLDVFGKDLALDCQVYCAMKFREMIGL